jgi:hypothetical protein
MRGLRQSEIASSTSLISDYGSSCNSTLYNRMVVYDLFRECSHPTLKHRSLLCCLSSREQLPECLTALLALKHPDVPLFGPHPTLILVANSTMHVGLAAAGGR